MISVGIGFNITQSILPELNQVNHKLNLAGGELTEIIVKSRQVNNELKNTKNQIAGIISVGNSTQGIANGIQNINNQLKNTVRQLVKIVSIKDEIQGGSQTIQRINKKVLQLNAALKDKEPVRVIQNTHKEVLQLNTAISNQKPIKTIENTNKKVINLKKSVNTTTPNVKKLFNEFRGNVSLKVKKVTDETKDLKKSMKSGGIIRKFFGFFKRGSQKARDGLANIGKKNSELFSGISEQFPSLGRFAHLLKNPYVLAAAAAAAAIVATVKLISHLTKVSQEISSVERAVKFGFGANSQQEISGLARKVIALKKEFENVDQNELLGAAKAMSREFGIKGVSALKLLKQGLQATNGQLDIDQLKEYSTQLKNLGFTADQAMALVVKSFQEGVYQDKGADLFKEAGIRLKEMPKATSDALNKLGDSYGRLSEKLQVTSKTGKKLTISTVQGLKNSLKAGEIDVMKSVQFITRAMAKLNVKDRQEVTANIFGSPGEDAGERFLLSLGKTELSMKKLLNLQDPYIKRQNKRLGMEEKIVAVQQGFAPTFNKLKRGWDEVTQKARLLFYQVINGGLKILRDAFGGSGTDPMQALANGIDWVAARLRDAKPFVIDVINVIRGFGQVIGFVLQPIRWLLGLLKRLLWDTGILQGVFKITTVVIGLLINPLGTLALLFARLWKKSVTVRASLTGIWVVVKSLIEPFKQLGNAITGIVEFNPLKIKNALSGAWSAIKNINPLKDFKSGYNKVLEDAKSKKLNNAAQGIKGKPVKELISQKTPDSTNPVAPKNPDYAGPTGGAPPPSPGNIIGGGAKTENKNLTINIGKLVENITIQTTNLQEGAQDIEAAVKEILIRAIRNTEAIY
ncbi:hypothetical protein [uncultured Microscilla sp.]|uniref:hypothetical protein n=1 Tax=uncultured Microscilla sp. TaxID=432653 RepID=UPI0026314BD3|nr:hypothetical protein [uncultured Microscilla sp.]